MKLILNYWNRRWQSVAFDTETGVGRVRWFHRKPADLTGWASKQGGTWYAVWRSSGHLVFQAGADRWPLTDGHRFHNRREGSVRFFSIASGNQSVFELRYDVPGERTDPTYDELDRETEDFFYWVTKLSTDPVLRSAIVSADVATAQRGTR